VLGYDEGFFGVLAQLGTGLAIAGSLLLGARMVRLPLGAGAGLGSRCSARFSRCRPSACCSACTTGRRRISASGRAPSGWWDTALSAPLAQLGMIPMLTLIAVHAPPGRQATWFALGRLADEPGAAGGLDPVARAERGLPGGARRLCRAARAGDRRYAARPGPGAGRDRAARGGG
jgi:hypothetical protein